MTGLCYSSHSLHILQIWSTVASGTILNTAAGEPSFRADYVYNSSGDIFLSKISATSKGAKNVGCPRSLPLEYVGLEKSICYVISVYVYASIARKVSDCSTGASRY